MISYREGRMWKRVLTRRLERKRKMEPECLRWKILRDLESAGERAGRSWPGDWLRSEQFCWVLATNPDTSQTVQLFTWAREETRVCNVCLGEEKQTCPSPLSANKCGSMWLAGQGCWAHDKLRLPQSCPHNNLNLQIVFLLRCHLANAVLRMYATKVESKRLWK